MATSLFLRVGKAGAAGDPARIPITARLAGLALLFSASIGFRSA